MYNHKIDTTLGVFRFGWVNDKTWIAGKFDEPEKAKKVYTCNPHTGKYNFFNQNHLFNTVLDELLNFIEDLKKSGRLLQIFELNTKQLKKYTIKQLREKQSLIIAQIEIALRTKNEKALTKLTWYEKDLCSEILTRI